MVQDMPPRGGFPAASAARVTPHWGPSPRGWWALGVGVSLFGLAGIVVRNRAHRRATREYQRSQAVLAPLLQAQEDERYLRRVRANGGADGRSDLFSDPSLLQPSPHGVA